jgi:hypothetical protein
MYGSGQFVRSPFDRLRAIATSLVASSYTRVAHAQRGGTMTGSYAFIGVYLREPEGGIHRLDITYGGNMPAPAITSQPKALQMMAETFFAGKTVPGAAGLVLKDGTQIVVVMRGASDEENQAVVDGIAREFQAELARAV